MKRSSMLAIIGWAMLFSPADARHPVPITRPVVEMQVLVDGVVQPQYRLGGLLYLPVRRLDVDYVIKIRNHGPRRIEAVLSVDGLSVVNGQQASEAIRGYLVPARDSVEIPGWRRGDQEVAAFTFSPREESYAYLTGRRSGIGMIQLVAFEEQSRKPRVFTPLRRAGGLPQQDQSTVDGGSRDSGSRERRAKANDVGTGYGHVLEHHVRRVPFVRSSTRHRITICYGRRPMIWKSQEDHPALADDFTPPPPGWRRDQ